MSTQIIDKRDILIKKISLLLKFREYIIKDEVDTKNFNDIIVVKSGETEKILIHIVYISPLISGKVGVAFVRKMKEKMEKEVLPQLKEEIEKLRERLEKLGREKEAEPLETKMKEMTEM